MDKFGKILVIIAIVVVIASVAYLIIFKQPEPQQPTEPIKIGAVYPLTGTFASYGIEYKRGVEMAVEEINSQGGVNGQKLEVIYEDDGGDTTKSVTAVNKLINVDKVRYLFTAFSSASQATAPIAEQNKVLYISATVSKIGTGNYVFRDYWDMVEQGSAIGRAIKQEGIKKLGVIALNYGDTGYFLQGLNNTAVDVDILVENFNFGDADFKAQLTKIKDFNPDGILVYAFPGAEAMKITQQIQELKLDEKRLFAGATTYGLSFMYQQFSDTLLKMKAIDSWYSLDPNNSKAVEFTNKYKAKYGQDLVGDAAYPYDDIYALAQAIKNSGANASIEQIAAKLRQVKMTGAAGPLSFDAKGNSLRSAYLQIYTESGWQKYNLD